MQDNNNKKFLFWYCGKAVYEGDELHKLLTEVKEKFNGDHFAAAKHYGEEVKKALESLCNNTK